MSKVLTYHIKRHGKRVLKRQTINEVLKVVSDNLRDSIFVESGVIRPEFISIEINARMEESK